MDLAQRIVRGKIANLRVGLLRARRRVEQPSFTRRIDRMGELLDSVLDARSLASLMGIEGAATRDYFAGLTQLIAAEWGFTHRRRRPPPDPFNSLLSLGCTLLQETIAALEVAGLDPYVGFLHEARVGRPGLALDLVEEFRPVIVDSVALRAINTGMLRQEHFTCDSGPPVSCLLTNEGRKLYLAAYERRMLTLMSHPGAHRRVSYRVALSLQARALADELLGQAARYEPLVWK